MRLIDADKVIGDLTAMKDIIGYDAILIDAMIDGLKRQEAIGAVGIVRCKDCKHYKEFRTKRNKQIMRLCCRMGKNDMEYSVKPDDFCSYGERKDVIQK